MFAVAISALAAGCTSTIVLPTNAPTVPVVTPTPSPVPTEFPADQGWNPVLIALDLESDGAGNTDLDATVLLEWQGPGMGLAPPVAASVTSNTGEIIQVQATVLADSPTWVPPGLGVSVGIVGAWPDRVKEPKLTVISAGNVPFHNGTFALATEKPADVPLPAATGTRTLSVPGVGEMTAGPIAVAHSNDGQVTILAQHGTHVLQYGGDGDYWNVWPALEVHSSGPTPVDPESFGAELFDDSWAVDGVDELIGEDATPNANESQAPESSVAPLSSGAVGGSIAESIAAQFTKDYEPHELRLVLLAPTDESTASPTFGTYGQGLGAPATWADAGYDQAAITAGERLFSSLVGALDSYQEQCNTVGRAGAGITIGQSLVTAAAPIGNGTRALIETVDTLTNASGASTDTVQAEYALALTGDTWQVKSRATPQSLDPPIC